MRKKVLAVFYSWIPFILPGFMILKFLYARTVSTLLRIIVFISFALLNEGLVKPFVKQSRPEESCGKQKNKEKGNDFACDSFCSPH